MCDLMLCSHEPQHSVPARYSSAQYGIIFGVNACYTMLYCTMPVWWSVPCSTVWHGPVSAVWTDRRTPVHITNHAHNLRLHATVANKLLQTAILLRVRHACHWFDCNSIVEYIQRGWGQLVVPSLQIRRCLYTCTLLWQDVVTPIVTPPLITTAHLLIAQCEQSYVAYYDTYHGQYTRPVLVWTQYNCFSAKHVTFTFLCPTVTIVLLPMHGKVCSKKLRTQQSVLYAI